MSTSTISTTPVATSAEVAPVLPDLDPALGEQLGDEILLSTARTTKVAKVRSAGSSRRGGWGTFASQSREARAWTMGGQVD